MRRLYIYIISFFLLTPVLNAQHRFDNYKHLTNADGLPSTYTYEFAEDKYGFIWIATPGGLARYDGSKINRLEKIETDSVYLPSQHVMSLLITGDSLWIDTQRGLSILNLKTRKIINHLLESDHLELKDTDYRRTVLRDIFKDRQGNVWLAPAYGGFVKWDKERQNFTKYPLYPDVELPNAYPLTDQTSLNVIIQDVAQDSIM